jgi:hypothetical protein
MPTVAKLRILPAASRSERNGLPSRQLAACLRSVGGLDALKSVGEDGSRCYEEVENCGIARPSISL